MAASKRGRADRLAALERLIQPAPDPGVDEFAPEQLVKRLKPGKPGGRTIGDVWAERGFSEAEVKLVQKRLESTHWKRRLPTVAMLSHTAIGESYLRPVDY